MCNETIVRDQPVLLVNCLVLYWISVTVFPNGNITVLLLELNIVYDPVAMVT